MQSIKTLLPAVASLPVFLISQGQAALIFQDTYNTTADSLDSRFERGAPSPRQTFGANSNVPAGTQTSGIGVLTPTYTPNQAGDYHDQIRNGQLVLTGDAAVPINATNTQGIATLSPFYNFNNLDTLGNAVATRVSFTLDVFSNSPGAGTDSYSQASFTVGSLGSNGFNGRAESGTAAAGFSVRFVEDRFGAGQFGSFIQFYDGANLLQNVIANPAGFGAMTVELFITDPVDGNPWDGVGGGTTINVSVNGTAVGAPFTKLGTGYTENFMTMEGSANTVGFLAAEHSFDNLQVFSVPEPTAALLGSIGLLGLLRRRR